MRFSTKRLLLILIFSYLFMIVVEVSLVSLEMFLTNESELYEMFCSKIESQRISFEDEIFTLKEKALFYRINTISDHMKARSKNALVCISMRATFDDQDLYINNCENEASQPYVKTRQYDFWIGKELAATFFVLIDLKFDPLRFFDRKAVISLLAKIPLFALMLFLLQYARSFQPDNGIYDIGNHVGGAYEIALNRKTEQRFSLLSNEDYRFVVNLLNDVVSYWEQATNKDKISLATESKLWTVTIDKGSLRTATLDKYLDENKIPKNARIKTVIETANYVINNTEGNDESRLSIKERIVKGTEKYLI